MLWRRSDGLVFEWSTNGTSQTGSAFVGAVGNEWAIVGTGDFNADGRADILWQRDDGLMAIWEMNGAAQIGSAVGWHDLACGRRRR